MNQNRTTLSSHANNVFVKVRASAGARKESIVRVREDKFEVAVKEKAKQGAANDRIRTLLARALQIPLTKVRLHSGRISPSKIFKIY